MRICPYPFSKIDLNQNQYIPCCEGWLTSDYYSEFAGKGSDWNGPAALALRQSMLDGSFRYCNRSLCQIPLMELQPMAKNPIPEAPISELNFLAAMNSEVHLPEGPSSVTVHSDPRCNLACPSCRTSKITALSEDVRQDIEFSEAQLEAFSSSIEVIRIGNGEILFSPWLKSLIRSCGKERFPRLKHIYAFSNGLLFNQRNYESLLPGISYLKYLSVSVDAGNSETYSRVRGGSWDELNNNLMFISDLRQQKKLRYFQLNFLVRKANYESIPEFVSWAKQFDIDNVKFNTFLPLSTMNVGSYEDEAVHLPSHPEFSKLVKIRDGLGNDPMVRWSIPL